MKKSLFVFAFLSAMLTGCSYQKPQMIIVDSNVAAYVYRGDKRIGETPFAGKVERAEIGNLYLKRQGYKTVKIPAHKVYSRSIYSMTAESSDATTDAGSGEDAFIVGALMITSVPSFVVTDISKFTSGTSVEYMPNTFYIEMVPDKKKTASADYLRSLQIKRFALKMYPSLAAGDKEAIDAFAALSGRSESEINTLLAGHADAVSFAVSAAL